MTQIKTTVLTVDEAEPNQRDLQAAVDVLRDDGLVAFPTETVYGLGARALSAPAVRRIFEAKGRPATNPLIVHVSSIEEAKKLAHKWPAAAQKLADAFWPGPLTLVVRRSHIVGDAVCAGLETVALRMPAHPVAQALIEAVGEPLAAPSANRYTEVSPTTAAHVVSGLDGLVELVIDAGPTSVGVESTLVSVAESPAVVLRPGMITVAQLSEIVEIRRSQAVVVDEDRARPSPGMSKIHYSPRARVRLVDEATFSRLRGEKNRRRFIGIDGKQSTPQSSGVLWLSDEPESYGRDLYAALHRFDEEGVDEIVVQMPPEGDRWEAIRDRLRRAAQ